MKTELIEKVELLLQSEDILGNAPEIRILQSGFETELAAETDKAKQEFIAEGGNPKEFVFNKQADDLKLEELFKTFRELKKEKEKKVLLDQMRHLELKRTIIEKIKALGNIQTQPGKAIKTLKDLQTQWKEAGAVSSHNYKELQNEYSKALEAFYYSLDIYKVMQDHDFKKNLEIKTAIIEHLTKLKEQNNIKEIERLIKVYRNEWDEAGPVQNDKWEALKTQWRSALDQIYDKLKTHYTLLEEQKEKNLAAKQHILTQTKALVENMPVDEEGWKKSTDAMIALQKEWKSTGFTQKGKGAESWKEFRETCDLFFDAKNVFYAGIKEVRNGLRKQKLALIETAEALSTSTAWSDTANKMIRLQADWKRIPPAGPHEEPRLFHRFRKACNVFFDAKKKHFEDIDAASVNEVKAKEDVLARFLALQLSGDEAKDKETLQAFSHEWQSGSPLPPKDRKRLNDQFYHHMDEFYSKLNIQVSELESMKFKSKLERLEKEDPSGNLLQKEFDHIKKLTEQIHLDVLKYENNLGFFKSSKGDNPLLNEIRSKIESEKERHALMKAKLKMVREALNRVVA